MDPTFTPSRLSLGKLFMRSQRWADAVSEFDQVVKLDPNLPETYYQLGLAYGRLKRAGDAQAAMATFKRLSDAEKKHEDQELREVVKRLSNVRF
jgi:Flp pilus assembly protein TadD